MERYICLRTQGDEEVVERSKILTWREGNATIVQFSITYHDLMLASPFAGTMVKHAFEGCLGSLCYALKIDEGEDLFQLQVSNK